MITIKINLNDDNDIDNVVWEDRKDGISEEDVATFNELLYDWMKGKIIIDEYTRTKFPAIQFVYK